MKLTGTPIQTLWVLTVIFLAHPTGAFLPNNAGVSLPATDYTLTEITVNSIVRTVARYFEDTNPDRYSPGDLTGLVPLTPSTLFRRHYGDCVYATKFEQAIKAILDANVKISQDYAHKAIWHFNGNQIKKGNRKMVGIRDALLALLQPGDENAPDYDLARQYCGQYLHLAHSFYSNTNWIELNRRLNSLIGVDPSQVTTSSELGIIAPLSWRESPGSVDMCQNCPGSTSLPGLQDCSDNLRKYVYYLTGGYRSGQDKTKPAGNDLDGLWGQCSHGGRYDDSWTEVATGGINKESTDETRTPHTTFHEQAALTAIQATEDFFYGLGTSLYALIGERKFRRLLNLDVGTSLTFVIDVSGSMGDDIEAVKEETIRIVQKHNQTCLAASNYVVVPFSDPEFGPVLVTTEADECIEFLSDLSAYGGGDCPELANSGLELGIQNSINGANVYMFTDASDKDKEKVPDVLALIEAKKVQVKFLLTGTCNSDRRRKRATDWSKISESYRTIAEASGGEIYQTDKIGIADLTKIIEGDLRASDVTITQRSSTSQSNLDVEIPVDSVTQEFLVSLVGALTDDMVNLTDPSGNTGSPSELGADVFTSSEAQIVFSVNVTEPNTKGLWVLNLRGLDLVTEYRVKVSASSFLDFTFDLLEMDETDGAYYPIDGKPVAGAETLLMVQVSAPEFVSSVGEIRLYNTAGNTTLVTASAEPVTGRTEGLFSASITLPSEPFFVSIVGQDTKDMMFLRTQPSEIAVVEFKLEQVPGSNTIGDLIPGGTGNFTFRVTNSGPADTYTITVSVLETTTNLALAATPGSMVTAVREPASFELATGETGEGMVTVTAAEEATPGTSAKVTLSVESTLSSTLNFISLYVSVYSEQNDTIDDSVDDEDDIAPNCTILESGGGCTADQMNNDVCSQHSWWVRARAMDNSILTEVVVDPEVSSEDLNGKQFLQYEAFALEDVTFKYTASCCCPIVEFTVRDGAGAEGSCGKDLYTPVSGEVDKPVCNGPIPVDTGLSIGAIVGIAMGSVAVVLIVVGVLAFFLCKSPSVGKAGRSVTPLVDDSVDLSPVSYSNQAMSDNYPQSMARVM